ncbi:MAG: hypothetical protein SFU91_06085 [Chloroherpetonaceae bacterium]|nr:hypothetical protein [Chloroherpetonaceae bacterium]
MSRSRALAVMAIGEKYQQLLTKNRHMFEWYAKRCNADFIVFDNPLDRDFKHNILIQKVLLPSKLKDYELVCAMDLDIIISAQADDIFLKNQDLSGVSGVLDSRESEKYRLTSIRLWKKKPDEKLEAFSEYFSKLNLEYHPELQGSINAGVWVFRPKAIAVIFEESYYSEKYNRLIERRKALIEQGIAVAEYDEAIIAYESQTRGLFQPLSESFNTQIVYTLFGTDLYHHIAGLKRTFTRKLFHHLFRNTAYGERFSREAYKHDPLYIDTIDRLLNEVNILHFAGGYHIPEKYFDPARYKN